MRCKNCKSKNLKKILLFGSQPISSVFYKLKKKNLKNYPLDLYECQSCKLVQFSKLAPIDDLVKRMDDKEFDMVAVGRALLSDPEWVNKVKEGRYDEVIPFSKKHAENYY